MKIDVKYIILITLLFFSSSACFAQLEEGEGKSFSDKIVIGIEESFVPFANPDGTGMAYEIINEAYNSVGIEVNYSIRPYRRLLKETKSGILLGFFKICRTMDSEGIFVFHEREIYKDMSSYYQNSQAPMTQKSLADFNEGDDEVTIGFIEDFRCGDIFTEMVKDKKLKINYAESASHNLAKLERKRIDAVLMLDKTADILIDNLGLEDNIEKAFNNEEVKLYIGFSAKHPEAAYYAKKLDEGLEIIHENGVYNKIISSY